MTEDELRGHLAAAEARGDQHSIAFYGQALAAYARVTAPAPVLETRPLPAAMGPRRASRKQLLGALRQLGQRDAWLDAIAASSAAVQDYWSSVDPVPDTNPKVRRLAAELGIDLGALFDVAAGL